MAQGVPVIGSNSGSIPEVLGDDEYGLTFQTNNTRDLQDKLLFVHQNRETMSGIAEEARLRVHKLFTAEKMTDETTRVYEKISR
jgi:glycosyltransferase involved in cell wall biosynthesis